MWATIEKGVSIANRRVYPAIISILRIYLDNTSLCTLRILCFFKHNDWIHDSSFGDQTTLDVNKNIFPYKSQVIKARPIVLLLHSVNQDSITLSLSFSLSARLIPFMGPFQEAGPCFIDSIMKHLNIKRMPTYSQQVARLLRVWTDLNSIYGKAPRKRAWMYWHFRVCRLSKVGWRWTLTNVKFSLTRFKKSKGMASTT